MKRFLSSKVVTRSCAIILSIAMVITSVSTPVYVKAEEPSVVVESIGTESSAVDIALKATASANAEHSDWGILATNLNNGHTPTLSSAAGGSWHDYGIESSEGTSWVQYDWASDVTVDSMSIYWMCDGNWAERIPQSAKVEYKDASGKWQTALTLDATVMATQVADQYNKLAFGNEITTKCIRMTMVRNTADNFCSIHRWQVWGKVTPVDVALKGTASANAEHTDWGIVATNLNNGHTPTASSAPGGSWHDYGIESTEGTSWVQYDWASDVTVDSMSIYWMCDGKWAERIPQSAKVEYQGCKW